MDSADRAGDHVLVLPVRREIWRPFRAYGVIAGVATFAAVIGRVRGDDTLVAVCFAFAGVAALLAPVRTATWRLRPARVTVTCDETAVYFRRGGRVVRSCPWSAVQELSVVPGDGRPEWSRWAAFSRVLCVTGTWPDRGTVRSPEILLVRPEQVHRAQHALDAAVRRCAPHAVRDR